MNALKLNRISKKEKQAWPTKAAMEQIYEKHLWGVAKTPFYSGEGSHNPDLVEPYIKAVSSFLQSFDPPLTVCDLGCGDFNIGKQLLPFTAEYHAVDIVPSLIAYNQNCYKADKLQFSCLDIATDALPQADCAIIRQVLQHLSNREVLQISKKLSAYNYVIVTEHVPAGPFESNKDIISGQGIRIKQHSGVDLLKAPFNLRVKRVTLLVSIPLNNMGELIQTNVFQMF